MERVKKEKKNKGRNCLDFSVDTIGFSKAVIYQLGLQNLLKVIVISVYRIT
jgi:hypothetical protein